MFLRQLFDAESSTYTYLLADEASGQAALIDAVLEQVDRDVRLIGELGFSLAYVLDTHVHADHVTGAGVLRERTGARSVTGKKGAACADLQLAHGDELRLGGVTIRVLETPGHTDDSLSFLAEGHLFSGDALTIRGAGRTDFQNGDAARLFDSITNVLFALPDATHLHPAHDYKGQTASTIGEEKRFNARIAGRTRDEFIAVMNGLKLQRPAKIDVAVAANLECGAVKADRTQA